MSYQRENEFGETEYGDGEFWMNERNVCSHCRDEQEANDKPYRWADQRHSFGCYAGRYCNQCWPKSGYRDSTDSTAEFSELDAGERIDADY